MRGTFTTNFPANTAAWVSQIRAAKASLDQRIEIVGLAISANRKALVKNRNHLNALLAQKRAGVR